MKQKIYRDTLPAGYNLHWYEIKSIIGRGGYGITYLALDKNLDRMVAIKEYLPTDFASRESDATVQPISGEKGEIYKWGLDRFLKEARVLAKFKHTNVVRVMSVFEQNNTAYMIMEYEHGENLAKLYKQSPPYTQQQLMDVFLPILDGLALVHDAGFIHRDIKPANIYIREDNSPVLLDFGSARRTTGSLTHALTSLVTFGYAPFEQYNENGGKQGPWTDIYSLGATMYLGIIGKLPVDAMSRGGSYINDDADPYKPLSIIAENSYTPEFLLAIDNALMFRTEDRPQDTLTWKGMLLGKKAARPLPMNMLPSNADNDADDQTIIMPKGNPSRRVSSRQSQAPTIASGAGGNVAQAAAPQIAAQSTILQNQTPVARSQSAVLSDLHDRERDPLTRLTPQVWYHRIKPWMLVSASGLLVVIVIIVVLVNTGTRDKDLIVKAKTPAPPNAQQQQTPSVESTPPASSESQQDNAPPTQAAEKRFQIAQLLKQAELDFAAGRIIRPQGQSAVYHYLSVLDKDPENTEATEGIDKILTHYSNTVESYLAVKDFINAEKNVKILEAISSQSTITIAARKQFEATRQGVSQITAKLEKAQKLLREKQYTRPKGTSAYDYYQSVLELDPKNQQALNGIAKIVAFYQLSSSKYLKARNVNQATTSVRRLQKIAPDSTKTKQLHKQLKTLVSENKKIDKWIKKAEDSFANNRVSKPKSESALFWYKKVLALDPKNSKALSGMRKIIIYYYDRFNGYLAAGKRQAANNVMKTLYTIAPTSSSYKKMKKSMARSKRPGKPEIEVISELIGSYKFALESQDLKKIKNLSAVSPSRESFMNQLFDQYKIFKVNVSGVKFIGKENRATAQVSIVDLVNTHGDSVQPGRWSKYDIEIRKNIDNQWKIFW